jgi:putative SOS response-associated peptidase YedK
MCGRYRLSRRKQIVEEQFEAQPWDDDWSPRYNVAPTQLVPVIRQNPKEPVRELSLMCWGLIPSWAKDSSVAAKMINARSESARKTCSSPLIARRVAQINRSAPPEASMV